MIDLREFEMPNGEVIKIWNDDELAYQDSLEESFGYYYDMMLSIHGIEIKP